MTAVRLARARCRAALAVGAAAFALAAAGCGPYAEVAQKLDVTTPFERAETWVSAQGTTDVRVLVLGAPRDGTGGFIVTTMQTPVSAGTSMSALQGDWVEDLGASAATFVAAREYVLADERGKSLLTRLGAVRRDVERVAEVRFVRSLSRVVISGDPAFDGTYRRLPEALGELGSATEHDAACAFQVVNLAIRATHLRIIGFGGPGMTQYQNTATFRATLSGATRVEMSGYLDNRTKITFGNVVELNGIRVDGPEITEADSGGNGHMSGTLSFSVEPAAADGAALPALAGTLDYSGGGDPADAVQIRGGTAVGGHYVMTLTGGGNARVSPADPPSPAVAECLALPLP